MYADVIVDITGDSLDRTFQYRIPEAMRGQVRLGSVVLVPFGRGSRLVKGYVMDTGNTAKYEESRIKDLEAFEVEAGDTQASLVALAGWMKERYGCTMAQALRTVIPIRSKVRPKEEKEVTLATDRASAAAALEQMVKKNQKARVRLLKALLEEDVIPMRVVRDKLGISAAVLRPLQEQGLVRVQERRVYRKPTLVSGKDTTGKTDNGKVTNGKAGETESRIALNADQLAVVDTILTGGSDGRYLLHGVTGSGKTAVYLELIEEMIRQGKQSIVLIPEIALTYQTVMRFYRRFGDRVSLINSRLSAGERFDQFERAARGDIDVMIGPRSALFTPFPNLGMIVIDEEHERSYISESTPRYNAREVAVKRCEQEHALLLLGSATPSLESYYAAMHNELQLLNLRHRAVSAASMAGVETVDLRLELKSGNRGLLSRKLQEQMRLALAEKGQIMLFLNRRGYAGFLFCRSCGHVIECPHCDVSLSLHNDGRLKCHYCGYETEALRRCPECGSEHIAAMRAGTQQIEQEVATLFPEARTLRMDADTTREKDSYSAILSAFAAHEADILIGTQMIVKGHDFPDVTLVGILAADVSLAAPDYRSAERTFQLLTQAAGRAGRGKRSGRVIIQTYEPWHYSIETAAKQDYESFYRKEIERRREALYPPTGALTAIHVSGPDEEKLATAVTYLQKFAKMVSGRAGVEVMGPTEESISKVQDIYRKVLYLKGPDGEAVRTVREKVQSYIEINEGFNGLGIQFEVE